MSEDTGNRIIIEFEVIIMDVIKNNSLQHLGRMNDTRIAKMVHECELERRRRIGRQPIS